MNLNGLENYFNTNKNGLIVDFKQEVDYGYTPLLFTIRFMEKLSLSEIQWNYLLKNSDIKNCDSQGSSALRLALIYKNNFQNGNWKYLIDNSDLSLIKDETLFVELKKIQSKLINNEILNKIKITENLYKKNKI